MAYCIAVIGRYIIRYYIIIQNVRKRQKSGKKPKVTIEIKNPLDAEKSVVVKITFIT